MRTPEREPSWRGFFHQWGWRDTAVWVVIISSVVGALGWCVREVRAHASYPGCEYFLHQETGTSGCTLDGDVSGSWTAVGQGSDQALGQPVSLLANGFIRGIAVQMTGNAIESRNYRVYTYTLSGPVTLVRSGTMAVGTVRGWYTATFAPFTVTANEMIHVVVDMEAGDTRYQKARGSYLHHNISTEYSGGSDPWLSGTFGATGSNASNFADIYWAFELIYIESVYATSTPTATPTATATPLPTSTRTPTPTTTPAPTPAGTPIGTVGPSGHVWVDNLWEIAQPIRELPAGIVNAFATLVVPEPTMIVGAQQTAEAATGVNVANAQATAAARWQTTVDVYDTKTNFVTEIAGLVGELRDALVDAPCGDVGITISPTIMGKVITLDFFTEEQLDVWWCPVFRPLLEAALYLLLTVSALMLWMRFRRSGGNE